MWKLYLIWFLMTFLGLVWGFVTGLTFAGAIGLDPATMLFGVMGFIVIGLSLVVAAYKRENS